MGLYVPVCKGVLGFVLLCASDLNLLEAPLGQVDVAGAQITTQNSVLQSECCGESSNL